MSVLQIETNGDLRLLTLNRPESLNAINGALRTAFIAALGEANADAGVRAVVITGAGDRSFCAGQDLTETAAYGIDDVPSWLRANHAMYQAVRDLDKPAVCAFNGVAAGAGFQIGLCSDLRVGFPELRIGQPEIKAGLASIVGTQLMTQYVGIGHNAELSLLGDLVSGQRAYEIGLLSRLVPKGQVLETAVALARALAQQPATAMRLTKQRLRALTQPGFDDALRFAISAQKTAYASGEPQAAMHRFLEARARRQ
ncbi:MAG: enoyl-CoA hydratase/isomerase family protein [Burkholderiales bacterium]